MVLAYILQIAEMRSFKIGALKPEMILKSRMIIIQETQRFLDLKGAKSQNPIKTKCGYWVEGVRQVDTPWKNLTLTRCNTCFQNLTR